MSHPPSTTGGGAGDVFSAKLGELRTLLGQIATAAPDAAQGLFQDLTAKASALCASCGTADDLEAGAKRAAEKVITTVRAHPAKAALVVVGAVGAGVLAWWFLTRTESTGE
jgi:hypothetical protein